MAIIPGIGSHGGQQYDIVRAIQTFLGQMAEGGIGVAAAVIKELLQNADDAGATEVSVILDERPPPPDFPSDYRPLLVPAILVRNNRPFKLKKEVAEGDTDDFTAICDVASGHKRAQATAAGRFGIGFNSVYFLTDTPVLFSRREVHVFDLLHLVFKSNGWRFSLDEFPEAAGSLVGPVKNVVNWLFPKAALGTHSFESVAHSGDFKEAVVRLPLRDTTDGDQSLHPDRFRDESERDRVLHEMADQAAKAILFLKNVRSITFGKLRKDGVEPLHDVSASELPATFVTFLSSVAAQAEAGTATKLECHFDRTVTWRDARKKNELVEWNFWVRHVADFSDDGLRKLRERLTNNGERAIPWGAIAIPKDESSVKFDGEIPAWRVFLPLRESGPSACAFCGAFFVGPSRQHIEFRIVGSDEALRKTDWNKKLVEKVLVPLLVDASSDLPERIPNLISAQPKLYLSLFPSATDTIRSDSSLAEHFRKQFADQPWTLQLFDIWEDRQNPIEWLVGDEDASPSIEMIPEWLLKYRDRFATLSNSQRRFVKWPVGEALRERVSRNAQSKIRREASSDVARAILSCEMPPEVDDLKALLDRLAQPAGLNSDVLDGLWTFARAADGKAQRYSKAYMYVFGSAEQDAAIHASLRQLGLTFEHTEWVKHDAGLPMLSVERRHQIQNLVCGDAGGALHLLSRVKNSRHDLVSQSRLITPIVDFLLTVPASRLATTELKLSFLVRTATNQNNRRKYGIILLKPDTPSEDESALWEGLFRHTLAAVDSQCTLDLRRLLNHHAAVIPNLSDNECVLRAATIGNALEILDIARMRSAGFVDILRAELNKSTQPHARDTKRAVAAVIHQAVLNWGHMSQAQQDTVLALPIHRTSAGEYVSLIGHEIGDRGTLSQRCRIQSNDNISDAPVELSNCCLLDSAEPSAKQLYREFLRLYEHGRIAVLMDVLRQIGSAGEKNVPMMDYLARYLYQALERPSELTDEAERKDAADLQNLAQTAKSVHCIDGVWRTAPVCRNGWAVVQHLESQGWKHGDIKELLLNLFPDVFVAAVDERSRKLLERVHPGLERLEPREIANLAVTSTSERVDLLFRLKLIFDNRNDLRDEPKPSVCISKCRVPTISGTEEILSRVLIRTVRKNDLSPGLLKTLAPETVDLTALASQIGQRFSLVTEAKDKIRRQLPDLLAVFGVAELDEEGIRQRIANNFATLWPSLGDDQRLELLECVKTHELIEDLKKVARTLRTVPVCGNQKNANKWTAPDAVISPSWMKTKPPCLSPAICASITTISNSVREVWDSWCGINRFESVAALVVEAAAKTAVAGRSHAASQLYQWLDQVQGSKLVEPEEFIEVLRGLPWVLASQSGNTGFQRPAAILIHAGETVLSREFWVRLPDPPLPNCCSTLQSQQQLGFLSDLPASADTIQKIAKCLEHCANADREATIAVYRAVSNLFEHSDELKTCWRTVARERPVFRLFRDGNDRVVPASAVFVGNDDYREDFGELLFCLRAVKPQPEAVVISLFKQLFIAERPEPDQLLTALSKLEGHVESNRSTYHNLIDALRGYRDETTRLQTEMTRKIRIATCAGHFRPVAECYWSEVLCDPKKLDQKSRQRMIDATDTKTRQLVEYLFEFAAAAIQPLTSVATTVLSPEPQPVVETPAMTDLLNEWRNWFAEIANPDSILHDEAGGLGLTVPASSIQLLVVERIAVCFRLPNGDAIKSSADWLGPEAFCLDDGRVFVRADQLVHDLITDVRRLEAVDRAIREQVASLLCDGLRDVNVDRKTALDFIKETVERPSVVLERLRTTTERNYFFQYNDQAADPDFANLYDEFVRTKEGSQRHQVLADNLRDIVTSKFVAMRREQIRAHGYDEFSVFAELVQNAEDAYIQRQQLGLNKPPSLSVAFQFESYNQKTTLSVEHYGRPFNCWRHGNQKDESFRKDVEGVLRSSGSFKPHSQANAGASQVIGKFGLGFKSVYLLTDCPSIFSGGWHFRIEDGCLPVIVGRPIDLPAEATRISLPLLHPDRELRDAAGQLVLCLLPFLRQTEQTSITHSDGRATSARRSVETLPRPIADDVIAELVTFVVSDEGTSRDVRIIRVRSTQHAGQLAMFLASDDLPAPWSDGFTRNSQYGQTSTCDFYCALPLKSELGCGVAVSHRFDLQSGRTHLRDSKENSERAKQIADLLLCLSDAIQQVGQAKAVSERLLRFWGVWRWKRGDAETKLLRACFAKQLLQLSRHSQIVPTRDAASLVSLSEQPLFFFGGVPQPVIESLVDAGFVLKTDSGDGPRDAVLANRRILAPGFVQAFRRACQFAEEPCDDGWVDVDWTLIGEMCRGTPWLATHPTILNVIADSASEDAREEIVTWLPKCSLKASRGDGKPIQPTRCSELLLDDDDVRKFLPVRFLMFVDATAYSASAKNLLSDAGVLTSPASTDLLKIILSRDLTAREAGNVLRYLQQGKRWRDYDDVQAQFRDPWFPAPQARITVAEGLKRSLVDDDAVADDEFKAWLGLRGEEKTTKPPPPPQKTAQEILLKLHAWWQTNGQEWTNNYERRTYGGGKVPALLPEPDLKDRLQRKHWLSLFLLGSCHTIGRTKVEQHGEFLLRCQRNNWLDTFADPDSSAQDWIELLESYLNQETENIKYYQWAKLFVPIFHLSRWLDGYVYHFASITKRQGPITLSQITSPRTDPASRGGGRNVPSISRTLGIGVCFVLRELCRLGVVESASAHPHCYVPSERVRHLLSFVAQKELFDSGEPSPERSARIFGFLKEKLGSDKATFDRGFDLPLVALCESPELQIKIIGCVVPPPKPVEVWRTINGNRVKIS